MARIFDFTVCQSDLGRRQHGKAFIDFVFRRILKLLCLCFANIRTHIIMAHYGNLVRLRRWVIGSNNHLTVFQMVGTTDPAYYDFFIRDILRNVGHAIIQ